MPDLAEFLLARIAEDEDANDEEVRAEVARCRADGMPDMTEDEVRAYWGDQAWWKRRIAECTAKRRIVEQSQIHSRHGSGLVIAPDMRWVLTTLAAVYADHPDYDPEWSL